MGQSLTRGDTRSCGCLSRELTAQRVLIDLVGRRFGCLTVEERAPENDDWGQARWICRCDCGGQSVVPGGSLRSGRTKSCGCQIYSGGGKPRHGLSKHPLYSTWSNMVRRCTDPQAGSYPQYGGRGIRVCDRWMGEGGVRNFIEDMGERPPDPEWWDGERSYYSLDRIDVNGPYSPVNCRWASTVEQRANQNHCPTCQCAVVYSQDDDLERVA